MTIAPMIGHRRPVLARTLALALTLPLAFGAMAREARDGQEQGSSTPATGAAELDTIEVVGSRIRRTRLEGPAPVVVITREDIRREGYQTVADALQTLTQNTTASFTGDLGVGGFSPNAQVVNLRNLGPGYTLTLVNGRRPAQYPQPYNRDNNVVNVRAIPSSIIERIEVLTGGASSIYGSDAVAGVVNLVLREDFEGRQLGVSVGTTASGGGDSVSLEVTGGATGDRWSTTYALQAGDQEPVFASQREFLSDLRRNPYGISPNPPLSLVAIRGIGGGGQPAGFNALYDAAACDAFGYSTVTSLVRGTYCGSYTQSGSRSISNASGFLSGYSHTTFDITNRLQFFASASYYQSEARSSAGTEFWNTINDPFTASPAGEQSAYYYDPQFADLILLQRVFNPFELGGEEAAGTRYDEHTYELVVGLEGRLGERLDWQASFSHGRYDYSADRPRLLARAVHDYFLGPPLGHIGPYPVFRLDISRWNTPITPEIYRSFSTRVVTAGETTSSAANVVVTGDLFELPAGPVGFAGVLESGRQTTDLRSDPRTDPNRPLDGQTIYNLRSSGRTEGGRDRYALGVEFRVPLFESLTVHAAARYDKYDDITRVDDAITRQLGLEWRPLGRLLLRASYATSFRAPDMQLVFAQGAASFSGIVDEFACRSGTLSGASLGPRDYEDCAVTGDPTAYAAQTSISGNPNLREERGESWGAGLVWDITDGLDLSVDYYRIRLEDAASELGPGSILRAEAGCRLGVDRDGSPYPFDIGSPFCRNILGLVERISAPGTGFDGNVRSINSAYINTALQDTSGIDATLRYQLDTDRLGSFRLGLSYSLVLTNQYKQFSDQALIDYRDISYYGQRSRARGSLGWARGDWSAQVTGTRYGSNFNFAGTRRLPPYMLYNLVVGKRFGENVSAELVVQNLLDNPFRHDPSYRQYPWFEAYAGADPLGRRFNARISYRF